MKKMDFMLIILFIMITLPLMANNISIDEDATITDINTTLQYANINFDISWYNSWRLDGVAGPYNWDAAWVFAKWKLHDGSTDWAHCTLNTSGHTAPTGSVVENSTSSNPQTGVFIYRSSDNKTTTGNAASVDWENVKIRWNYGTDGVFDDVTVDIKVFAIEMVYITECSFYVGDTDTIPPSQWTNDYAFYDGGTKHEFEITSEDEITVGNSAGELYYYSYNSNPAQGGDQLGPIPSDFPKGYQAFYCMKYEISQGQYADFLSLLTDAQDDNRYPDENIYRHTISGTYEDGYTAGRPNRACNYIGINSGTAYADWAGLRPMTELEYEKICRGPLDAVNEEYAWGNTTVTYATNISGTENGTETITNSGANCCHARQEFIGGDEGIGPLRCGIFAADSSTREQSGASYYGVMEMSGNLAEYVANVGDPFGRNFTGINGNGVLAVNGDADVANWPEWYYSTACGCGIRGGGYDGDGNTIRMSDRSYSIYSGNVGPSTGMRCVRTK